jgi:NAD(P)H-dependent FMN reductase
MPLIKVILGSTRDARFGVQPAEWIMELSKEFPDATFELVDLATYDLPFMTDATPPMMVEDGNYPKEAARKWSQTINEADGYIIVTAEYNFGVPAPLKNAIDTLSNEWNNKPVAFVSYGTTPGGARAVEHLRGTAGWLKMYDLREQVMISNYWSQLDENGKFQADKHQVHGAQAMFKSIIFWADQMKEARAKLAETTK